MKGDVMSNIKKVIVCIFVLAVGISIAYAQYAKPEEAIKYRKSVMSLIVQHFKGLGAVVQGKAPYDKDAFAKNAEVLKLLATLPWQASMEPGTDKGDTTLSAAVFKKPDEFKKAAKTFENETAKLAQLASAGDLDGSKAQFGVVAESCSSCHKQFRTK
jgi:cytochrome c556